MKLKFFLPSISISIISLFVSHNTARAAYFSPLIDRHKANLIQETNHDIFVEELNVISYIGDNSRADYKSKINNIVSPNFIDENPFVQKKNFKKYQKK